MKYVWASFCLILVLVAPSLAEEIYTKLTAQARASTISASDLAAPAQANSQARQSVISFGRGADVGLAESTRGVFLQGRANFSDDGERLISPDRVKLLERGQRFCLIIGQSACLDIPLDKEVVNAAQNFVAAKGVTAFSAVGTREGTKRQNQISSKLTKDGLRPISASAKETASYDNEMVHKAFLNTESELLLQWVDSEKAEDFSMVSQAEYDYLLRALYGGQVRWPRGFFLTKLRMVRESGGDQDYIEDGSFFIGDYGSNYILAASSNGLACLGSLYRLHWLATRNSKRIQIIEIEELGWSGKYDAANDNSQSSSSSKAEKAEGMRWLACTTAAIRSIENARQARAMKREK